MATIWAILAAGGLLGGGHVAWLGPGDKSIAEAKAWLKAWLAPLIVGASPAGNGYDFSNGGRIIFQSIGPNAAISIRGLGFSLVVIDEAAHIPNLRLIIDSVVRPTLALAAGRILLISVRQRDINDFRAYYLEAERDGIAIHAPSSVNPNLKPSELEHIRRTTAPLIYDQEFDALWVEMAGALLKREYLQKGTPPPLESFQTICFGVDVALAQHDRSDYSALVVSGISADQKLWILHARRWRKTWPETVALLADYNRAWVPQIAVCEQVAFQELAVRDLVRAGLPLIGLKVSKGKEERFLPVLTKYALRMIWHSDTLDSEFEAELLSFPESAHDDQTDSLVYAVGGLDREIRSAWSGGNPSVELWRGLAHEKAVPKLYFGKRHIHDECCLVDNGEPRDGAF